MEAMKHFICTSDEETRQKLIEEGLIEIKNSNGVYTFLTNGRQNFAVDDKKVSYTSSLCI